MHRAAVCPYLRAIDSHGAGAAGISRQERRENLCARSCLHAADRPRPDARALRLGRAVHCGTADSASPIPLFARRQLRLSSGHGVAHAGCRHTDGRGCRTAAARWRTAVCGAVGAGREDRMGIVLRGRFAAAPASSSRLSVRKGTVLAAATRNRQRCASNQRTCRSSADGRHRGSERRNGIGIGSQVVDLLCAGVARCRAAGTADCIRVGRCAADRRYR